MGHSVDAIAREARSKTSLIFPVPNPAENSE